MKNNNVGSAMSKNNDKSDFTLIGEHMMAITILRRRYPLDKIGQLIGHTEGEVEEYISFLENRSVEYQKNQEQEYKEKVKQYGKNSREFRKNVKTGPLTNCEMVKIQKLRRGGESIHRISRMMNRDVKVIKSVIPSVRFSTYLVPVSN